MAMRTCHNCIYARFDACEWLHNAFFDLPLAPKCANHPHFPEEWPTERREEIYAQQDAAAKKEGKKAGRKEGKRDKKAKGRQSTQRGKRKNDAGETPATRSRKPARRRPAARNVAAPRSKIPSPGSAKPSAS